MPSMPQVTVSPRCTGPTPAGVGPVQRGDTVTCGIDGIADLSVSVV